MAEIQTFYMRGWPDGWQPDLNQSALPPGANPAIVNMDFSEGGTLTKRGGYLELGQAGLSGLDVAEHLFAPKVYTTSGLHPNFTQEVMYLEEANGEIWLQTLGELLKEYQFAGTGTDLVDQSRSPGVWDATAVNAFRTHTVSVVTYGDDVIMTSLRFGGFEGSGTPVYTNGTDDGLVTGATNPLRYDVQDDSWSWLAVSILDGTTARGMRARTALVKHERILYGIVHKKGASAYRYPSRVYWTHVTETATDHLRINAVDWVEFGTDDGEEVVNLTSFRDQIIVFKNTSVWLLMGETNDTFSIAS